MARVYIGIPTYKNDVDAGLLGPLTNMSRQGHQVILGGMDSSACAMRFNQMLIQAKEMHFNGQCDFFLLWHSDIIPEHHFLDKLLEIQKRTGAEILSAVVPIKDERGMTSTALDEPVGDRPQDWSPKRYSMAEVLAMPEKTWTHPKLLLNTGLFLLDLNAPWLDLEKINFRFEDKIMRYRGRLMAFMKPEDWNFSKDARALGCTKQYATLEVRVEHRGLAVFPSDQAWGAPTDDNSAMDPGVESAIWEANKIKGYMSNDELGYLAQRAANAKCVVELGSWKGRSTKAMAMTCKGKVYAVDSWRGSSNGDATGLESAAKGRDTIKGEFYHNVANVHANVVPTECQHEFAGSALKHVAGEVDFAFLDGDHAYEHIRRDILTALDLMAPGGILAGHDINEPGVLKAVNELLPTAKIAIGTIWEYTVPKAVPDALIGTVTASSADPLAEYFPHG